MKKFLLLFLIYLISSSFIYAEETFIIDSEITDIPITYLNYNETLNEDSSFLELENAKWTKKRQKDQSYLNGFWTRLKIRNKTDLKKWILSHNNIYTKTVFVSKQYQFFPKAPNRRIDVKGSKKEFVYNVKTNSKKQIEFGLFKNIADTKNFYDGVFFELTKDKDLTIYEWYQMEYYNRWFGLKNPIESVGISEKNLFLANQNIKNLYKFFFAIFIFTFCVMFLIHIIINFNFNYLYIFLTALVILILYGFTERLGLGFYFSVPKFFTISEIYTIFICAGFATYSQFIYSLLQSDEKLRNTKIKKFHYSYQALLVGAILISLVGVVNWPYESVTDLTKNPISEIELGPGLIPTSFVLVSYGFWLLPMLVISLYFACKKRIIAIYVFFSMLMLLTICFKYIVFTISPELVYSKVLQRYFADEIILGLFFCTMYFTASSKIRNKEKNYLVSQLSLKEAYSRFVPEELSQHLNRKRIDEVRLGDQKQLELSILFSDIRGFTTLSEKMSPQENFNFINSYLQVMTPVVKNNNGFVSAFTGDSIMALFDLKVEDSVETAIQMMRELRKFNHRRERKGFETINHGIGIGYGSTVLGTLGDPERMAMTVISSIVNTSSRIESLTKEYKVPVLLSEGIVSRLPENRYAVRIIDNVAVKGQKQKTTIYELLDAYEENVMYKKQRNVPLWDKAFDLYEEGDHETAQTYFRGILEEDPDDHPAQIYFERCKDRRKGDRRENPRSIEIEV